MFNPSAIKDKMNICLVFDTIISEEQLRQHGHSGKPECENRGLGRVNVSCCVI